MTGHAKWADVREQRDTTPERRAAARAALDAEVVAQRLVELRRARGLTQAQVADAMGVSLRQVSAIEHGDIDRSELTTLRTYVAALGGSVHVVAEFDDVSTRIA